MATDRYFLYLDVLGFTDLVRQKNGQTIADLYEVIASLNANQHGAFKVVVFSDTVVVYNVDGGDTPEDSSYLIMFLCEFVKDLMHRLTGRNIYFRAVITHGDFTHYELNGIPCFFGNALVDAYNSEKELKAIGLFIHKEISCYCDIFKFREFNENYNFVYVTQALDEVELWGTDGYPVPEELIEATDSKWFIYPELSHLANMYAGSMNVAYPEGVRAKYAASWQMYCHHYPNLTTQLVASGNDVCSIAPLVGWQAVIDRHPEDYSYAIKTRVEF
jgi:hypothetical protein